MLSFGKTYPELYFCCVFDGKCKSNRIISFATALNQVIYVNDAVGDTAPKDVWLLFMNAR